jgi:DNA (cytosine-5)-methyltransferase 1
MNVVSLFSGCGGLDLGFINAGFNVIWANEYDKDIWETYEFNHPNTHLDRRDLRQIKSEEIPDCIGIIGGPPCQSWSEAGSGRGINDSRGQLFYDYIRILKEKQPLFFLAENVSGILADKHTDALTNILYQMKDAGYDIGYKLLNSKHFNVPQDRKRVIIIGYREDLGGVFDFPPEQKDILTLKDAIHDLKSIEAFKTTHSPQVENISIPNHEYLDMGFSSIYMSRNRVRRWHEPSFTIQAGGRHAPIHPQANKMTFVERDKFKFDPNSQFPYRRLSVRECARIQTFPDRFIFKYNNVANGYKMVGNAVPVKMAETIASKILIDIQEYQQFGHCLHLRQDLPIEQISLIKRLTDITNNNTSFSSVATCS